MVFEKKSSFRGGGLLARALGFGPLALPRTRGGAVAVVCDVQPRASSPCLGARGNAPHTGVCPGAWRRMCHGVRQCGGGGTKPGQIQWGRVKPTRCPQVDFGGSLGVGRRHRIAEEMGKIIWGKIMGLGNAPGTKAPVNAFVPGGDWAVEARGAGVEGVGSIWAASSSAVRGLGSWAEIEAGDEDGPVAEDEGEEGWAKSFEAKSWKSRLVRGWLGSGRGGSPAGGR